MIKAALSKKHYTLGQITPRPLISISHKPLENALGWIIGLVVACGIVIINSQTHTDYAPTILYITLLLMAANLFSINVVILVALMCIALLTALFVYHGGYEQWETTTGFFRCLTALSAITFLALRSKYAADRLRHNEAYLTGAQRLSQTGNVCFCAYMDRISWSAESARIYEYPLEQNPTFAMILERTHPDDRALALEVLDKAARHESPIEIRHRLLLPDGRIKHVHMIASPLDSRHGRIEYLGALQDVTASKQAEEALFRAQCELAHVARVTSLGELAATIAHEVNQPLTAITSSGEACRRWLDRPVPDLEEARQSLDRIIASSCRASGIISRIRAMSRRSDPTRQPEPFDDIVNESLSLVQREIELHTITVILEMDTPTAMVCADRVQLQQVIINLIINAGQAMQMLPLAERVLRIRTWVENSKVVLEVADGGPGISADLLPSLFNPFFTTKENGMGMGLSICRSIIDVHGGRIWARSNEGQGTSFLFALPLLDASHREPLQGTAS